MFPSKGDDMPNSVLSAKTSSTTNLVTWHRRLAHLNADSILQMVRKGMVKGMEIQGGHSLPEPCEPCVKGKQTCLEIQKTTDNCSTVILKHVFSDVCGKLPMCSHQGFKYFVTWTDDKSRKVNVASLKAKLDVFKHLMQYVVQVELETGLHVKSLHTDGGGKYTGADIENFLKSKGVKHELTTTDTPQHNGVAERLNRTLLKRVWSLLTDADLPETYWFNALIHTAFIHNVTPTRALDNQTPEEAWGGNKPDISRIRVFRCKAFVHVPDKLRDKLTPKSIVCTHLGFAPQQQAYKFVHCPTHRFFTSQDVVFDEGGTIERVVIEHNDTVTTLQGHLITRLSEALERSSGMTLSRYELSVVWLREKCSAM